MTEFTTSGEFTIPAGRAVPITITAWAASGDSEPFGQHTVGNDSIKPLKLPPLYRIKPKQDWPNVYGRLGHWINGEWVSRGFVVTNTSGMVNVMPGATWFRTVDEAMDAVRIWHACQPNSDLFWKLWRRWRSKGTGLAEFIAEIKPQYGVIMNNTRSGYIYRRDEIVGSADYSSTTRKWVMDLDGHGPMSYRSISDVRKYLDRLNDIAE